MNAKTTGLTRAGTSPAGTRNRPQWLSVLNELYIDLLGSLVPGLFIIILSAGMVFITLAAIYSMQTGTPLAELVRGVLGGQQPFLAAIHYEIAVITLVSAYVIGAAFFRQDPKIPDRTSALFVWMSSKEDERCGLAVQSGRGGKPHRGKYYKWHYALALAFPRYFTRTHDLDTQFPYPYIKCYVAARGLIHLLPYIPWCPSESDFEERTKFFRTKMFINTIKVRLQSFVPEVCRDVVRNEAHVRLATSVWYASHYLFLLAVICIAAPFIAVTISYKSLLTFKTIFPAVGLNTVVAILCVVMKYQLTKCIHYMRVREVIYVLETAHIGSQINPAFTVDDITDKEKDHVCKVCPLTRNVDVNDRICKRAIDGSALDS